MKNWADHCSSDEESVEGIDDVVEKVEAQTLGDEETAAETEEVVDESRETHGRRTGPRTYDFPDRPPFTAFIGNLAYSLKDPEDLKAAVAKCAVETLGQELNIVGARIALDRDGKHRGFGYIELETLDEVGKRNRWYLGALFVAMPPSHFLSYIFLRTTAQIVDAAQR